MLKILQARLQQYVNCALPDVQAGFRKGRGTRDQIANIHWITKKAKEFHENIYFYFIDYVKDFDCVNHNKLWKILKEMGIPDHLTCLLGNLLGNDENQRLHARGVILECEVKWALESITMNKASGGDGIPLELFQVLKDDALKVLPSICQEMWKT